MCRYLCFLLFTLPVQPTLWSADSVKPAPVELSLERALDAALGNNLGLITDRFTTANQADAVVAAEAQFDVELFGNVSLSERQSAATGSTLDSAVPTSETRQAGVGASKRLSTGASLTLDSGLNRAASNNNAARNPDYSSDVGLSVRQPLLKDAGQTVNLAPIARAKVQAKQSLFSLRSSILDMLLETEIAYWNLAYAIEARALIASSINLAENLLEENTERERLGLVTPLEVLQAQTELLNQQEDIITAEQSIEDATDRLRILIGEDSLYDQADTILVVRELPQSLPDLPSMQQVVQDTVLADMDAAVQEQQIEVQRINRLLAKDETSLDLDLVGGVSYIGRDTDGESAYRGAYNADGYNWNVGMELRFPLGMRDAKAQLRQAERNLQREEIRLAIIKQEKALAARNAWRAVNAGVKRIEVNRQSLELNRKSFEQERARYGSGLIAYRQVLEAQRDLDRAQSNYLSAIIETLRAYVRLGRVDGSIMERHGYSWETLDLLAESPNTETHPLLDH